MAKSKIEWTGKNGQTWNPTVGCSRKSDGCKNCYAEVMTKRLEAMGNKNYVGLLNEHGRFNGVVRLNEDNLLKPLSVKKPTTFFVNSMSDLFHENAENEWIDRVFAVMALTPQHTFQVLTKRADRMRDYFADLVMCKVRIEREMLCTTLDANSVKTGQASWEFLPLPNVHLGVSVENQEQADKRIPLLLDTPASVRFLSCEPLLENIDFNIGHRNSYTNGLTGESFWKEPTDDGNPYLVDVTNKIDWVIVGGESGHKARPCDIAWIRSIVNQCQSANVPVFVKQLGANIFNSAYLETAHRIKTIDKKGGDINEFPKDLQIREFPNLNNSFKNQNKSFMTCKNEFN